MATTTNTTVPAEQATSVQYHFLITLQIEGGRIITNDGTISVVPGLHTRQGILPVVRDQIMQQWGLAGGCIVLFFALEPNQL
ncbi:hypothetical protein [Streptomyces sp. NPDC003863]